ncbi:hypothetical protein GGI13_002041 [Coemansia sp. RSA 455]|nr:hypothetical protein GGH13_008797 [Coemansia sp. S155-1]KAJ2254637.1 hypothetical protein GGI13_002041 [Coemansia sp. RSA 455]KAJ2446938.1 hypothetical protein GGI03_007453 [Coemansia sp. RSA 2337]
MRCGPGGVPASNIQRVVPRPVAMAGGANAVVRAPPAAPLPTVRLPAAPIYRPAGLVKNAAVARPMAAPIPVAVAGPMAAPIPVAVAPPQARAACAANVAPVPIRLGASA